MHEVRGHSGKRLPTGATPHEQQSLIRTPSVSFMHSGSEVGFVPPIPPAPPFPPPPPIPLEEDDDVDVDEEEEDDDDDDEPLLSTVVSQPKRMTMDKSDG